MKKLKFTPTGKRLHDRIDCDLAHVYDPNRPGGAGPRAMEINPDEPCPKCGMGCGHTTVEIIEE